MTSLNANEDGSFVMSCGCSTECVNGKYINILCEEHENELEELIKEIKNKNKLSVFYGKIFGYKTFPYPSIYWNNLNYQIDIGVYFLRYYITFVIKV